MPYRSVYEMAPRDPSLEVFAVLPAQYTEDAPMFGAVVGRAHINRPLRSGEPFSAYHCPLCDGWILGEPNRYEVHNLGPLSGRSGTEYYCRRCGQEIAFEGIMA